MKRLLIILVWLPILALAHDGEDHGDAKKATVFATSYFSSEGFSDKYELLVKYGPLSPGKEAVLKLFISEYNSNKPLDSAGLTITVASNPNIKVTATRLDNGVYELKAIFPEKKSYNLVVNINSNAGADLIQLNNIEAGKVLEQSNVEKVTTGYLISFNSKHNLGHNAKRLRVLLSETDQMKEVDIVSIPSETQVIINVPEIKEAKIFVYGEEVNDFRTVDYDGLTTLNISATQELSKLIDAQNKKIEMLMKEIELLKGKNLTALQAKQ